ncbi:hypothetical protein AB0K18_28945 [Nonomuraea sp. NPDC049421]|uniref:hypothetical protein n=1 Tax=Nonomuraea sp. NPDC049421 TaxID=3155275 RepID=UPI003429AAE7
MTVHTPAPSGTARRPGRLGPLMIGLIVGVVLCAGAVIAMRWPAQQTFYTAKQPGTVTYDDGSPHVIALIREHSLLEDSYRLYAGRDPSLRYGHFVDIGFPGVADKPMPSTQWTPEGVRVRFGTGHELFVPAASFTSGR